VWRLRELPVLLGTPRQQYATLSRSTTRVATARKMESTVTIADIHVQTPPHLIDTDVAIEGLVLTGNILLVKGSTILVAQLLTEHGLVGGVTGGGRVGRRDRIWTIRFQSKCVFRVRSQAAIQLDGNALHVYHTDTGEALHPTQAHQNFRTVWDHLDHLDPGWSYLPFYNSSQCDTPLEDRWKTSRATLRDGWVKDLEGKHRLWVPVEWRMDWYPIEDTLAPRFQPSRRRPVLIKF